MSQTQSLTYIVMNYFQLPQSVLQETIQNFHRKRDYYRITNHTCSPFSPIFNNCKVIADALNLTLITDRHFKTLNISNEGYIDMYPAVWSFPGAPYSLRNVVNIYHSNEMKQSTNDLSILPMPTVDFNFVYCDVPNIKAELPWNLETLTFSFDFDIWFLILLSIVTVTLVLKYIVRKANILETIFTVVGSLFPDVLHVPKIFRKVPLLYVWLFMCFVISNHYAATLTSLVIRPPQEHSLNYLAELAQNNFTILFDSIVSFRLVNASIRHQSVGSRNSDILAMKSILDLLSTKVRVIKNEVHQAEYDMPASRLASERNLAMVHMWQYVIPAVNDVHSLYDKIEPHKPPVHCYIGKRLVPCGLMYQVIVLPLGNNVKLRRTVLFIIESGIIKYWRDEFIEMRYANRVQERSKVISRTKIIYSFEKAVTSPLALEGKISSVFFLWVIFLVGGCCPVFVAELCYFKIKYCTNYKANIHRKKV